MVTSKARIALFVTKMGDPAFQQELSETAARRRADPYAYSQLPYWLSLDIWSRQEGLEALAGIEPGTFKKNAGGEWIDGQPFAEQPTFMQFEPCEACERAEFPGDDEAFEAFLEAAEHKRRVLRTCQATFEALHHRLSRSLNPLGPEAGFASYRPAQFLAWARRIKFTPAWLPWAETRRLLPDDLEPSNAPFFDADAADYPELLAIAVRAWEHARQGTKGTPKQRVLAFLADRYKHLPSGSRDAIAQVANWQRTGGRPRNKGK